MGSYLGIGVGVEAVWVTGVVGQVNINHSVKNDLQQTCAQTSLHSSQGPQHGSAVLCSSHIVAGPPLCPIVGRAFPNQSLQMCRETVTGHNLTRIFQGWLCSLTSHSLAQHLIKTDMLCEKHTTLGSVSPLSSLGHRREFTAPGDLCTHSCKL